MENINRLPGFTAVSTISTFSNEFRTCGYGYYDTNYLIIPSRPLCSQCDYTCNRCENGDLRSCRFCASCLRNCL